MKKIVAISLISFLLAGCSQEKWTAYYYPDGTFIESTWREKAGFASKDQCVDWIEAQIKTDKITKPDRVFDYECGKNCKPFLDGNVCELTEK